jgi:hypothetical protein
MLSDAVIKYSLTALAGAVIGMIGTFGKMTISNNSRVAAIEVTLAVTTETLRRIEGKIDANK